MAIRAPRGVLDRHSAMAVLEHAISFHALMLCRGAARPGPSQVGGIELRVAPFVAGAARLEPSQVGCTEMRVALFVAGAARLEPSQVGCTEMRVAPFSIFHTVPCISGRSPTRCFYRGDKRDGLSAYKEP